MEYFLRIFIYYITIKIYKYFNPMENPIRNSLRIVTGLYLRTYSNCILKKILEIWRALIFFDENLHQSENHFSKNKE